MTEGPHPPPAPPAPSGPTPAAGLPARPAAPPQRARRIAGSLAFCGSAIGGAALADVVANLTVGMGFGLVVAAAIGNIVQSAFIVLPPAFVGFLGATDLLPLFPRRDERAFARWSAAAGLVAGALSAALWTIAAGLAGGRGPAALVALIGSFVIGWIATRMLLGHALRVEHLHPLARVRRCARCGYDLRATRAGRCPECGAAAR